MPYISKKPTTIELIFWGLAIFAFFLAFILIVVGGFQGYEEIEEWVAVGTLLLSIAAVAFGCVSAFIRWMRLHPEHVPQPVLDWVRRH